MRTNRIALATLCIAAAGVFATSARADDTDEVKHFKIYVGPAYVAPLEDTSISGVANSIKAQDQVGWNVGFEGRINKWFGIELDYVDAQTDLDFDGVTVGETNFSPLTGTFNIHVIHGKVVDWYIGPSYAWVNWGDISFNANGGINAGSEVGTDSSSNWGISTGIDFNIGEHFAVGLGLKYLDVDLETPATATSPAQTYGVKPLVGRLTAAFRF